MMSYFEADSFPIFWVQRISRPLFPVLGVARGEWPHAISTEENGPCNFNTEMFVSKVGNPCPTLG